MNQMLLRRRVASAKSLPYDAEVEYLESTGTQYIDIGIVPTSDTGIKVKVMPNYTSDRYVLGLREDGSNSRWCLAFDNYKSYYGYGIWGWINNNSINDITTVSLNYNNSKVATQEYNGNNYVVNLPTLNFTPTRTIQMFKANTHTPSRDYVYIGRIFELELTEIAQTVLHLYPVRVGNVGYMYDKVSGRLFGNAGTGSFILGPDK